MPRPRGKAPTPELVEKETQVVELRREGQNWEQIAMQVGYKHPSGAAQAYKRAVFRVLGEEIETMRHLEGERLDAMHSAVWENALAGDHKSVLTVIKISERRSALFGLDQKHSPKNQPEQNPVSEDLDREIKALIKARDFAEKAGINLYEDEVTE